MRRFGLVALAVVASLTAGQACSNDSDTGHDPPLKSTTSTNSGEPTGSGSGVGGNSGPCTDGATKSCHETIGMHDGVLDCYVGTETCVEHAWSDCENGSTKSRRYTPPPPSNADNKGQGGGFKADSLSVASPCVSDPCDPNCQNFDEEPDGGPIEPDPSPGAVKWKSGNPDDLPPAVLNEGQHEPCNSADDCQFDQYCSAPASGACAHDLCDTGGPLAIGCDGGSDSCVNQICDADSTSYCCTYGGTCSHDPCTTGTQLVASCDTCVGQICGDAGGESCVTNGQCASSACQNIHGSCTTDGSACPTVGAVCGPPTGVCQNLTGTCSQGGSSCTTAACQGACTGNTKTCSLGGAACATVGAACHGTCSTTGDTCSVGGAACFTLGNACGAGTCNNLKCSADNAVCATAGAACHGTCSTTGHTCSVGGAACTTLNATCGAGTCQTPKCSADGATCGTLGAACSGTCEAPLQCSDGTGACPGGSVEGGTCNGTHHCRRTCTTDGTRCAAGAALGSTCGAAGTCKGTCSNGSGACSASGTCGAGVCSGTCSTDNSACTATGSCGAAGTCAGTCSNGTGACNTGSCGAGVCSGTCSGDGSTCTATGACGAAGTCQGSCSTDLSKCNALNAACGPVGTCQNMTGSCSTDASACNSTATACGPATGTCGNIHGTCGAVAGSRASCCGGTCQAPLQCSDGSGSCPGGSVEGGICNTTHHCRYSCSGGGRCAAGSAVGSTCPGTWDSTCESLYGTCEGTSCKTRGWDAACTQAVHDTCGDFCESNSPSCAHDECDVGASLTSGCSTCVASVCSSDSPCCDPASARQWDAQCVQEVSNLCGFECPVKGQCTPWNPKQTDPGCSGVDLTVGVPCAGTIPVCNRGNTTAPAGAKIIHFPAGSNQIGSCNPDQTIAGMVTCTTSQPIAPGACIDVTNCPGLTGAREIMVNPPGATQQPECNGRCDDNWSVYNPGACGVPSCSGLSTHATLKKVDMFVTIDKSGSMADPARWNPAMAALKSFYQDPTSAGLGVAMRFWPDNVPSNCDGPSCSFANCAQPAVGLGTLTAVTGPGDAQETALVNSINAHSPGGDTPMYAALGGAEQWATAYATAHTNEKVVVVMITDGNPTVCDTNVNDIAALAGTAFTSSGVQTYVIGIAGVSQSTINQIATAGGGQAFFIAGGTDTQTQLLTAMNAIRGTPVTCTFPLPAAGTYDPANVQVTYTPSAGAPINEMQVPNAGACGTGWYYDSSSNPTTITLCTSTCNTVKADSGASIDVTLGCPTPYQPTVYKQQYSGHCDPGQTVKWGFMSYETVTPSDSSILIQAQTGTVAGTYGTLHTLATAQATPDTQDCAMSGPSPCPIDLYAKLMLPDATDSYLQLVFTLNPSTDLLSAPELEDWDLTYTCVDSE